MKKISHKRARWLARRAARLDQRRRLWKQWRTARNSRAGRVHSVLLRRDGEEYTAQAGGKIPMPEVLCLDNNLEETLACLNRMRGELLPNAQLRAAASGAGRRSRGGRGRVRVKRSLSAYYDFSTIREMTPSAALVLAALFDHAKYIAGSRLHTVDEHRWKLEVRQTLISLGFHELLQINVNMSETADDPEIVIQQFTSGYLADGSRAGRLQDILVGLLPLDLGERLEEAEPYSGMLEAILNSHSWAYPDGYRWKYAPLKKWWLTGAINRRTNQVTVIAHDQGVTIPVTLPRSSYSDDYRRFVDRIGSVIGFNVDTDDPSNDGLALRAAMVIAKTSTGLPQHGKGLHTMIEVAERARRGRLRIISRNGMYVWETDKKPGAFTNKSALSGTLIEWTLDL